MDDLSPRKFIYVFLLWLLLLFSSQVVSSIYIYRYIDILSHPLCGSRYLFLPYTIFVYLLYISCIDVKVILFFFVVVSIYLFIYLYFFFVCV